MPGTTSTMKLEGLKAISFQQLASLAAATALTIPPPTAGGTVQKKAKAVLISVDGQSVRVRFDGVAPSATVGHLIANGDHLFHQGDLAGIQIIQTAATAVANVTYFA